MPDKQDRETLLNEIADLESENLRLKTENGRLRSALKLLGELVGMQTV